MSKLGLDRAMAIAIGRRLRDLRLARGMTQGAVAKRSGMQRPVIGRMERGLHLPDARGVERYCAAVEMPVDAALEVLDYFAPSFRLMNRREQRIGHARQFLLTRVGGLLV